MDNKCNQNKEHTKTDRVEFADELEITDMPNGNQEIGKGSKRSKNANDCK